MEYDNNRLFIHITLNPGSFYKINLSEIQQKDSLTNNINEKLKKFEEDINIIFKVEIIKSTFLKTALNYHQLICLKIMKIL